MARGAGCVRGARGGDAPLVIEPPATESRVAEVELTLGYALPARLRRFFLEVAASVQFQWFLPTGPARFFLNLLPVFEAGHLPCGWKGRWPRGTLALI